MCKSGCIFLPTSNAVGQLKGVLFFLGKTITTKRMTSGVSSLTFINPKTSISYIHISGKNAKHGIGVQITCTKHPKETTEKTTH